MDWAMLEDGYGIVHRSVLSRSDLSRGAKLTYALLASYAGGKDEAWPSQETMGKNLQIVEKSIREWVDELVEKGLVTKKLEGFPAHNVYRVGYPVRSYGTEQEAPVRSPGTAQSGPTGPVKKNKEEEQKKKSLSSPAAQTKVDALMGTGLVRKITDYYQSLFIEEYPGFKPTWDGKTIKLVKGDIARMGDEHLGELIQLFFEEPPDFVKKNGTGLGYNIFHSMIDRLIETKARRERKGA